MSTMRRSTAVHERAAHGGQVLVTKATHDLAGGIWAAGSA